MNKNISVIVIAVIIVFCMVTVGFVGMGYINSSSYEKYEGLQMNIFDFGGAARNTIGFFTTIGDYFATMLHDSNIIPKPMRYFLFKFNEYVIATGETRQAEIIIYGYQDSTLDNFINHQFAIYRVYAFKEEGTKLNSYFNNLGYKFLQLRSWINNGDRIAYTWSGDNKNDVFIYINENILSLPYPSVTLDDNESRYTYISFEQLDTFNIEEYTIVESY